MIDKKLKKKMLKRGEENIGRSLGRHLRAAKMREILEDKDGAEEKWEALKKRYELSDDTKNFEDTTAEIRHNKTISVC